MINREQIDELFRYLLAGVSSARDDGQARIDQSRQMLSAFSRIDDPDLRQELVVLMEIVAQMPEVLQRKRDEWGKLKLSQLH
jgi:hypothetical protein